MNMHTKRNLGALAGGTEALTKNEAAKLPEQYTPEPVSSATFLWCKASGSIERLTGYPSGVAI